MSYNSEIGSLPERPSLEQFAALPQEAFDRLSIDLASRERIGIGDFLPPVLPGADTSGRTFLGHGKISGPVYVLEQISGPVYVSPTITTEEPLYLRVAYMPLPLDRPNIGRLLEQSAQGFDIQSTVSRYLLNTPWGATNNQIEQSVLKRLMPRGWWESRIGERVQSVEDLFQPLQELVILTLALMGNRDGTPNFEVIERLCDRIGHLNDTSHTLINEMQDGFGIGYVEGAETISLRKLQEHYAQTKQGFWRRSSNGVVSQIVSGLFSLLNTAGANLETCPHCKRFFETDGSQKLFCSGYCRREYSRQRRKRQAQEKALKESGKESRKESGAAPESA